MSNFFIEQSWQCDVPSYLRERKTYMYKISRAISVSKLQGVQTFPHHQRVNKALVIFKEQIYLRKNISSLEKDEQCSNFFSFQPLFLQIPFIRFKEICKTRWQIPFIYLFQLSLVIKKKKCSLPTLVIFTTIIYHRTLYECKEKMQRRKEKLFSLIKEGKYRRKVIKDEIWKNVKLSVSYNSWYCCSISKKKIIFFIHVPILLYN